MKSLKRLIRLQLYQKDPYCFWCGTLTVFRCDGQHPTDDDATIEHLDDRLNRFRNCIQGERRVIACACCNAERARSRHILEKQLTDIRMIAPSRRTAAEVDLMQRMEEALNEIIRREEAAERRSLGLIAPKVTAAAQDAGAALHREARHDPDNPGDHRAHGVAQRFLDPRLHPVACDRGVAGAEDHARAEALVALRAD